MQAVNLAEAKAHLSSLVSKAQNGEETIITRRGLPVAKLVPIVAKKTRLASRAAFRAATPTSTKSSATLIRELRDAGY